MSQVARTVKAQRGLTLLLLVSVTGASAPLRAESCAFLTRELLAVSLCPGVQPESISEYRDCYEDYYDQVIPIYRAMGACSHNVAQNLINVVLTGLTVSFYEKVTAAADKVVNTLEVVSQDCVGEMLDLDAELESIETDEKEGADLDEYRETHYGPQAYAYFAELNNLRQAVHSACVPVILQLNDLMELLRSLALQPVGACERIEDEKQGLQYTAIADGYKVPMLDMIDPDIDLGWHLQLTVSGRGECVDDEGTCTVTLEGGQQFEELKYLSQENKAIITTITAAGVSTLAMSESFMALWGSSALGTAEAGALGGGVGAVVAVALAIIEYGVTAYRLQKLKNYIQGKDDEIRDIVQDEFIKQDEFLALRETMCREHDQRTADAQRALVAEVDYEGALQQVDAFFARNQRFVKWYNELLQWGLQTTPDGNTRIEQATREYMLQRRIVFEQSIHESNTELALATQMNHLNAAKGELLLADCNATGSTRKDRRKWKALQQKARILESVCVESIDAIAQVSQPIPYDGASATTDITCRYLGYRRDATHLELTRNVDGTTRARVYDDDGSMLWETPRLSSEPLYSGLSAVGLICSSASGASFGTSESDQLRPGTYDLEAGRNIYGFGGEDAQSFRRAWREAERSVDFKMKICDRRLFNGNKNAGTQTQAMCAFAVSDR